MPSPTVTQPRTLPGFARTGMFAFALLATSCGGSSSADGDANPGSTTAPSTSSTSEAAETTGPGQSLGEPDQPDDPETLTSSFTKLREPGVGGRITSLAFDPSNPDRLYVGGDMLGIAITDDFGETWQSTSGLASWEIGDITATTSADGRIWTGSLSGPQASADGGTTWQLSRNGMPAISGSSYSMAIETVLIDPIDPNRLLAFNGNQRNWSAPGAYVNGEWSGDGSVWESTDSGANWSQLSTIAPGGNIRAALFTSDDTLLAAVANRGVWISTDNGSTWVESSQGLPHFNPYDITADSANPNIAWVALGVGPEVGGSYVAGGIWKTTDGGTSWVDSNSGLSIVSNATPGNTGSFHQIVAAPSEPNRLYTSNVAPGQAAIYRSDDGGDSWRVVADGSTSRPNAYEGALRAYDIAVHPTDPDRIAIGSDDTLLGSKTGGDMWTDLTTIEDTTGYFHGRGYSGLVSTDIVFNPEDPDELVHSRLRRRQLHPEPRRWPEPGGEPHKRSRRGAEVSKRHTHRSTATGSTYCSASSRTSAVSDCLLMAAHRSPSLPVPPTAYPRWATWKREQPDWPYSATGRATSSSPSSGHNCGGVQMVARRSLLYRASVGQEMLPSHRRVPSSLATDSGTLVSVDQGQGFNDAGRPPAGLTTLYTSSSEPDSVYGVAFREGLGGVHRFDGQTWTQLFDDEFAHGVAVDPTNADNLAVVTTEPAFNDISAATGVHLSSDGGATWTAVVDGLPMTRLRTAEFDPANPDRLVVGTTGRGFYEISFAAALGG